MPNTPATDSPRRHRRVIAALFLVSFTIYALTASRTLWHTDVFGANWTSWHIATTGSPWIDNAKIPEVGNRSDHLLAIVQTSNGHTAFGRFPGVVAATLPAYLIFGSNSVSMMPAGLTAALLSALALSLMYCALRRYLTERESLLAVVVFGFATPVWSVSANLMWPHTITVLGIAGMAWAASSERWWWAGVFGGVALSGRLHAALIPAVLGLGVGIRRRALGIIVRVGVTSSLFLVASCAWNRWVYGSWSPFGGYSQDGVTAAADSYRYSITNQLGMWVAPDRGILVWTPIVVLLLPALARSWRSLPDWSRSLLAGGLVYTILQAALMTFNGGDGFYGYRYGLEFLACAMPALALSAHRMGALARVLVGPVIAVQAFAFLLGGLYENLYLLKGVAWRQNAFVHVLDRIGPSAWIVTALIAGLGYLVGRWMSRTSVPVDESVDQPVAPVSA